MSTEGAQTTAEAQSNQSDDHNLSVEATGYIHQELSLNGSVFDIEDETVTGRQHETNVECSCGEQFNKLSDGKIHLKQIQAIQNDEVVIVEGLKITESDDESTWMVAQSEGKFGWNWEHSEHDNSVVGPPQEQIQEQVDEGNWIAEYTGEYSDYIY